MTKNYPQHAVIVSVEALASEDPYDLVYSNVEVINAHLGAYLRNDELSADALRSYFVDYFLAQLNNGGFSQFVYNSRWGECVDYITEGFAAMGANEHLKQFEDAAEKMSVNPGIEGLKLFMESEYFGENPERDTLSEFDDGFFNLQDTEDLIEMNAAWLRGLPHLVALSSDEIEELIRNRSDALPDKDARIAEAREAEPRYLKLIRALCAAAGQELDCVTAGDPSNQYEGRQVVAWHFLTDHGHHHMIDLDGKAIMFKGHTAEVACEIPAGAEYGED